MKLSPWTIESEVAQVSCKCVSSFKSVHQYDLHQVGTIPCTWSGPVSGMRLSE